LLTRLVLGFGILVSLALPAPAETQTADEEETYAAMCERAIVNGARRGGVPAEVLYAISLTETGRMTGGRLRPWPWAINREGKGHWFKNREEAVAFGKQSLADGRKSFDVGCVQINYRWHGHAFPSLDDMFDPEWTSTYAAQFLRTLYEERGSWSEAAGAYHSLSPEFATVYRKRFDRLLADLDPTLLDTAAIQTATLGPSLRFERRSGGGTGQQPRRSLQERQQAARELFETRRRELGPPPAPAPGGVASTMFLPAAGALLPEGRPLLNEAQPLLTAPRSSLY
jgi:hypothetical protein